MLIVKTNIGKSEIQGIGLFASEKIEKGQPIWSYKEGFDLKIPLKSIPQELRGYLDKYSTITKDSEEIFFKKEIKRIVYEEDFIYNLDGDDCKYMNHSETPNVSFNEVLGVALKDIEINEELTCDYRTMTTPEHFELLMLINKKEENVS